MQGINVLTLASFQMIMKFSLRSKGTPFFRPMEIQLRDRNMRILFIVSFVIMTGLRPTVMDKITNCDVRTFHEMTQTSGDCAVVVGEIFL